MVKKRAKKKTDYFAEREEDAVVEYIITESIDRKHTLYNDVLCEPFRKMTESILRKYPTHIGNYDIYEVEANALSHLIEHMIKYRPFNVAFRKEETNDKWKRLKGDNYKFIYRNDCERKAEGLNLTGNSTGNTTYEYKVNDAKAFSYCQTIVRNYYKDHSRKSYGEKTNFLSWEDHSSDILEKKEYLYEIDNDDKSDLEELIDISIIKIRDRIDNDGSLKKNEIIVGEAITNVLSNWHILFLEETPDGKYNKKITNKYQKNKILQLLKEQTRLNTKEIRTSMKAFKDLYFIEKDNYFKDEDY